MELFTTPVLRRAATFGGEFEVTDQPAHRHRVRLVLGAAVEHQGGQALRAVQQILLDGEILGVC